MVLDSRMFDKVTSLRLLSIILAAAMLALGMPEAAWADDAGECASTTIAADRSAAACRRLADQGKAWAQYNLGVMYDNGRGLPQDYKEAVKWYRKAADQGNADAENNLGASYEDAEGVQQDYDEAVKWYRKAAEQGHARAQTNLGWMYRNGKGVARDDKEAAKWFRKAADQGDARAQNTLGWMYSNGEGVAQDDKEAVRWYRKAADQDYASAQTNLGWMYRNGKGVAQDDKEAIKWYRLAAEQGNANAQHNLGVAYKAGEGVSKDLVQAYVWFDLAAKAYSAGADRDDAIKHRDSVVAEMTPDQIAKAKKIAAEWKPRVRSAQGLQPAPAPPPVTTGEDVLVVSPDIITFFNGAYQRLHPPKAIAVSADGFHMGYSYCEEYRCKIVPSARDLAMQACAQTGGHGCRIFAVGDDIKVKYRIMD